jgi:microcystin-dependent protein
MPQFTGRLRTPALTGAAPTAPTKGEMYYDNDDDTLYWWNGTVWKSASGGAPSGAAGGDLGGTYPNPTVVKAAANFDVFGNIEIGAGGTGGFGVRRYSTSYAQAIPLVPGIEMARFTHNAASQNAHLSGEIRVQSGGSVEVVQFVAVFRSGTLPAKSPTLTQGKVAGLSTALGIVVRLFQDAASGLMVLGMSGISQSVNNVSWSIDVGERADYQLLINNSNFVALDTTGLTEVPTKYDGDVFVQTGTPQATDTPKLWIDTAAAAPGVTELVGAPIPWLLAAIPSGYLEFNGQTIVQATYPTLYGLFGATLPDLRGKTLMGYDGTYPIATTGGATSVTLTAAQSGMRDHYHDVDEQHRVSDETGTQYGLDPAMGAFSGRILIGNPSGPYIKASSSPAAGMNNAAASSSHENLPPYRTVKWITRAA